MIEKIEQILETTKKYLQDAYTEILFSQEREKLLQSEEKAKFNDIVTVHDKKVEEILSAAIIEKFPTAKILGEEGVHASSLSLEDLRGESKIQEFWCLDPIDGTTNFSKAYPFFCSTIAFLKKNDQSGLYQVQAGGILNPILNELYLCARGKGAFLNGKRIYCSSTQDLKKALLCTGFAQLRYDNKSEIFDKFQELTQGSLGVRRDGSAALDLAYVARGSFDAFWEQSLSCWDIAAGSLLVEEAGGQICQFTGTNFNPLDGDVIASNKGLHQLMRENLIS